MAKRLIGTGTTGTDGSCSIPYVGTGAGLVQMDVETEIDGSIVSGTYPVIDGFYYDTVSSDTNQNYYVNTTTGTSIAYSNGYLVLTLGTGSKYTRLKDTKYTLADLKGETIHFSSYIKTSSGTAKVVYYDDRSGNLVARENGNTVSEDTSSLTVTIPSNVTAVAFQIEPVSMSTGDTISFKDFLLYITTSS